MVQSHRTSRSSKYNVQNMVCSGNVELYGQIKKSFTQVFLNLVIEYHYSLHSLGLFQCVGPAGLADIGASTRYVSMTRVLSDDTYLYERHILGDPGFELHFWQYVGCLSSKRSGMIPLQYRIEIGKFTSNLNRTVDINFKTVIFSIYSFLNFNMSSHSNSPLHRLSCS